VSVLISGGTIPLGLEIARLLLERGRGPVLLIGVESPEAVAAKVPEGAIYHRVDLTRPRRVRRLLFGPCTEIGVQALVHLAFHRSPKLAGQRAHRLNVDSARLMLRLAEDHPSIQRFVLRSASQVYLDRSEQPDVLREDQPLNLDADVPQWMRDRVEVDVTVCSRMGLSPVHVSVLRCSEILAPDMGSQLYDYLSSRICVRPIGFDPMLNVLSLRDAAEAFMRALDCEAQGAFNIPGADTLSLRHLIHLWGRAELAIPGPLVGPVYRARALARGRGFDYAANRRRFHFNGVIDGERARRLMGYVPQHPLTWPEPQDGGREPRSTPRRTASSTPAAASSDSNRMESRPG